MAYLVDELNDESSIRLPNGNYGIARTCLHCGIDFGVERHQVRMGLGKFCSQACYHAANPPAPAEERFWPLVDKAGDCWLWIGTRLPRGYGTFSFDGVKRRAHRVSWIIHYGPIPDGLFVLHKCDNPPCVRPDHLFLGDHGKNMADMTTKGRQYKPQGEQVRAAKLTTEIVAEILREMTRGATNAELARRYGVAPNTLSPIRHGHTWKHVPRP